LNIEHDLTTNLLGPWWRVARSSLRQSFVASRAFTRSPRRIHHRARRPIRFDGASARRARVRARTSGSAMMFAGTSGVLSHMLAHAPMATTTTRRCDQCGSTRRRIVPEHHFPFVDVPTSRHAATRPRARTRRDRVKIGGIFAGKFNEPFDE
jgi:hypothetical protein